VLPDDDAWLFRTRGNLAWCYVRLGRNAEAIEALKGLKQPRYTLESIGALDWEKVRLEYALALTNLLRFDEAESSLKDSLQQVEQVLGEDNYLTGLIWNHLGTVYQSAAKWDLAIEAYTRCYALMRRTQGDESQLTLGAASELAISKYLAGRVSEALPMLQEVHTTLARTMGADAAFAQDTAFYLAAALADAGRPEEASGLLDKLQGSALNSVDPGVDWDQRIVGLKGIVLQRQGNTAAALPLLKGALARLTQDAAPDWVLAPLKAALKAGESDTLLSRR
jgi:tetratricopeptide (TPR) repeat protein